METRDIITQVLNGDLEKGLAFQILLTGSLKRTSFSITTLNTKQIAEIDMCHLNFVDWVTLKLFLDEHDPTHNSFMTTPLMTEKEFANMEIPIHQLDESGELSKSVVGNHLSTLDKMNNERHFYFYYVEDVEMYVVIQGKVNKESA